MIKLKQFLGGLLCALGGWMLTACSSDEDSLQIPEGKGYVKLNLTTNAGFQTKAVNESEYEDENNYTVQILRDGTTQVGEDYTYSEITGQLIELERGTYTIKAFKGIDSPASTTSMYVVGSQDIIIANEVKEISFVCKPVCAKVKVAFDTTMDTYFEDYSISFQTVALGEGNYTWEKNFSDPVYLKVNEKEQVKAVIKLTKKDGIKAESSITQTYELSPLIFKTIKIKPSISSGSIGIEITIDEGTNDQNVDIEVPSDWV